MDTPKDASRSHAISVNVYGRGDKILGDGPSHTGLAVYQIGSATCQMHHIRCPDDESYLYDPRTQPLEDPVLRGRCELVQLTAPEKDRAVNLLSAFGQEITNIPEYGVGNCQDWVAGAVTSLEMAGIVKEGEGQFWQDMINLSAGQMQTRCDESGRAWIEGKAVLQFEGSPDARFSDREGPVRGKSVGKLTQNPAFRERIKALGGDGGRKEASEAEEDKSSRPFYISSPFFSQTK